MNRIIIKTIFACVLFIIIGSIFFKPTREKGAIVANKGEIISDFDIIRFIPIFFDETERLVTEQNGLMSISRNHGFSLGNGSFLESENGMYNLMMIKPDYEKIKIDKNINSELALYYYSDYNGSRIIKFASDYYYSRIILGSIILSILYFLLQLWKGFAEFLKNLNRKYYLLVAILETLIAAIIIYFSILNLSATEVTYSLLQYIIYFLPQLLMLLFIISCIVTFRNNTRPKLFGFIFLFASFLHFLMGVISSFTGNSWQGILIHIPFVLIYLVLVSNRFAQTKILKETNIA